MIGKITSGQNFLCAIDYISAKGHKDKRSTLLFHSDGIIPGDNRLAAALFEAYSQKGGHHLSKPLKHISLSFSKHDRHRMSDAFMEQVAREYMDEMDIKDTEFLVYRHHDKEHPHCHIVFSRVDRNGNVWDESNDRLRNAKVCKHLTMKYGLYMSPGKKEVNMQRVHGMDFKRYEMARLAMEARDAAADWKDFECQLRARGMQIKFCINNVTGKLQGVSFYDGEVAFSGKKLDNSLVLSKLTERFGQLPDIARNSVQAHYDYTRDRLLDANFGSLHATENIEHAFPPFEEKFSGKADEPNLKKLLSGYTDFTDQLSEDDTSTMETTSNTYITLNLLLTLLIQPYGLAVSSGGGGGSTSDLGWRDPDRDDERNRFQFRFKPMKSSQPIVQPKSRKR